MMPLNVAVPGEENIIRKIGGNPEVKKQRVDKMLAEIEAERAKWKKGKKVKG